MDVNVGVDVDVGVDGHFGAVHRARNLRAQNAHAATLSAHTTSSSSKFSAKALCVSLPPLGKGKKEHWPQAGTQGDVHRSLELLHLLPVDAKQYTHAHTLAHSSV